MSNAPAILRVKADILIAAVESLQLALVVLAGNAQQEVREVDAGLAAEEYEIAVQLGDRIGIDLIVVELAAHLDGVSSDDFGEVVAPLKGVVDLLQLVGVGSDREVIEIDAFHSFGLGRQRNDAGRVRAHHEALGRQADADAAHRLAEIRGVAHEAEVEFVDGGGAERLGIAQAKAVARVRNSGR